MGLFFLLVTFFVISLPRSWSLYSLGSFLIVGFLYMLHNHKRSYSSFKSKWFLIFPPVIYFFVQLMSLISRQASVNIIEDRLMFILVPVVGYSILCTLLSHRNIKLVFYSYILGISVVSTVLLLRFAYLRIFGLATEWDTLSFVGQSFTFLFSESYSLFEHPSYLSMKIVWVIAVIIITKDEIKLNRLVKIVTIFLLTVSLFFLASKAGIVLWISLIGSMLYLYFRKLKARKLLIVLVLPLFSIASFSLFNQIGRVDRFIGIIKEGLSAESIDWKNLDQRTREWHSALQLIKEKPVFGHGLAKVEERMVQEYLLNGWEEEASLNLNAHNQFLEAQMTFGIAGTLSLLWMLLTPIIFRKRLRYPKLAVAFVLMVSFFLLFESMFNRQWGIMFFVLFYCLLVFPPKDDSTGPIE